MVETPPPSYEEALHQDSSRGLQVVKLFWMLAGSFPSLFFNSKCLLTNKLQMWTSDLRILCAGNLLRIHLLDIHLLGTGCNPFFTPVPCLCWECNRPHWGNREGGGAGGEGEGADGGGGEKQQNPCRNRLLQGGLGGLRGLSYTSLNALSMWVHLIRRRPLWLIHPSNCVTLCHL